MSRASSSAHLTLDSTTGHSLVGSWGAAPLMVSGWLLFAAFKNELLPGPGHVSLWEAIVWQLQGRGSAGFMFTDGSDANNILKGWLSHDPYLVTAGMLLSFVALFFRQSRGIALVPVLYFVVALGGGYIPGMYIVTPLPFFALIIVFLTWKQWLAVRSRYRAIQYAGRTVVVGLVAASLFVITPSWAAESVRVVTENQNVPYQEVLAYVDANLPRNTTVLTDGNAWNDLVKMGWSSDGWSGPIWHFQLDRDPMAQAKNLPGWRKDVDHVFLDRGMEVFVG